MENDKEKFKIEFQKRLVRFTVEIVKMCNKLREKPNYWPICDQIIRSSSSIGANVIEARSSSSKRDFIKFFDIALKSANETEYWLLVIESLEEIKELNELKVECDELSKILASSLLKLKGKK